MADGDALLIGKGGNEATRYTYLDRKSGGAPMEAALYVNNDKGAGLQGLSLNRSGSGLEGVGAPGVFGLGDVGVYGESADGVAVHGNSQTRTGGEFGPYGGKGIGVRGTSESSMGVSGESQTAEGVRGYSASASGVSGRSAKATGVAGFSDAEIGVFGGSWNPGYALLTLGSKNQRVGVYGLTEDGTAIYGESWKGLAGEFQGSVEVHGSFTQVGPGAKSAAVLHPDGSHRRLYCLESTESWFEDFGEATLAGASTTVPLDPEFLALVDGGDYHVFLTAYGPTQLYVEERTDSAFQVAALPTDRDESPSIAFSYRVVARRKDVEGRRLEKVDVATREKTPPPVSLPDVPTPPRPPDLPVLFPDHTRDEERGAHSS
jgi:hypothetical protein